MAHKPKPAKPAPQPDQALPMVKVLDIIGVGRTSLWKMVRNGTFPPPISLTGGKKIGWRASTVYGWLAAREPIKVRTDHAA